MESLWALYSDDGDLIRLWVMYPKKKSVLTSHLEPTLLCGEEVWKNLNQIKVAVQW